MLPPPTHSIFIYHTNHSTEVPHFQLAYNIQVIYCRCINGSKGLNWVYDEDARVFHESLESITD